jgi:hypothetical protein
MTARQYNSSRSKRKKAIAAVVVEKHFEAMQVRDGKREVQG